MSKVAVLAACACFAGSLLAQDEISRLNTILDIDALYTPLESKEIHGETAVSLLRELQTKHYSAVEIDDNFSSVVFDSYLDLLDSSHLYFLKEDV
ncbi:MAG: hypothetical protein QGF90_11205, partial [Gammaproteobacteria bacterium]|nr:hypothetical protein [Gammaproteobacteria bacterium]